MSDMLLNLAADAMPCRPFTSAAVGYEPVSTQYRGRRLTTHFQPIFSIAHRRAVGYEGLIRVRRSDGTAESPGELLALPETGQESLALDRICRGLHIQNFARQLPDQSWLFINLDSQYLINEQPDAGFTRSLLDKTGIAPQRLVIEIIENKVSDHAQLQKFISHFRSLGCLIAIDDFGAGHSNVDRIWELEPDIVKVDRGLIQRAGQSPRIARLLTSIVSLIHEAGSLVVLEGIETEQEAMVALAANADMLQGFFFARPHPRIADPLFQADTFDKLRHRQQCERAQRGANLQQYLQDMEKLFSQSVADFTRHQLFARSSAPLLQDVRAVRCYLLDQAGYQIASNIYAPHYQHQLNARFAPLLNGENANWSHKHYHYRAIQRQGTVQLSKPYLSVADSRMCVTLSQTVSINNKLQVFCCDLDWPDQS